MLDGRDCCSATETLLELRKSEGRNGDRNRVPHLLGEDDRLFDFLSEPQTASCQETCLVEMSLGVEMLAGELERLGDGERLDRARRILVLDLEGALVEQLEHVDGLDDLVSRVGLRAAAQAHRSVDDRALIEVDHAGPVDTFDVEGRRLLRDVEHLQEVTHTPIG